MAKCLCVRLRTQWFWVQISLLSLKLQIWRLLRARSSLTFRQTIECGFTLKLVRDVITTYRLLIQLQKLLLVREWHKWNVKYLILLVQLLTLSSSRKLNKLKENAEFVKKANLNTKISTAVTKLATKGEITMCENRCQLFIWQRLL